MKRIAIKRIAIANAYRAMQTNKAEFFVFDSYEFIDKDEEKITQDFVDMLNARIIFLEESLRFHGKIRSGPSA